ncbi:protein Son isoform X2 [Phymastichus coffea]|nr:protein Son isoform X2 [Phymastichus coffea]
MDKTKVKVKVEKDNEPGSSKKKKSKKKHKHKNDNKDKEKKHKHKKNSKHDSSDSVSDAENGGSKRKKKKKKSKRKHESDSSKILENEESSSKRRKLDKENKNQSSKNDENSKKQEETSNAVKIKQEKIDNKHVPEISNKKDASPVISSISKRLDDDAEAPEVPKLLEKTKNSTICKIQIKDLKNSEVYNNTIKEVENKIKKKVERMEDGEITDSEDENLTPSLSPTPPLGSSHSGINSLRSDKKRRSKSPSSRSTKKSDLRNTLKKKDKKKHVSSSRSSSKSNFKDGKKRRRSRDKDRSNSCHTRDKRTRSRSADRKRYCRERSRERRNRKRNTDRERDREDRYSRSEDRNRRRGRSRSKERKERIEIDKKKLLEIARRNAINMIKKGKLPLAQQDKAIAAIQAGGKSIEELTDFCKSLSKSEALGELSSVSSDDESSTEKGFHHPFLIKERPNLIIMNIRDAKQLPTKTFLEKTTETTTQLRLQFPVSSGQQHRKSEKEWIPVSPKPKNQKSETKKLFVAAKEVFHTTPQAIVTPPLSTQEVPIVPDTPIAPVIPMQSGIPVDQSTHVPQLVSPEQSVFPEPSAEQVDISSIVSQRLAAMRKLSENPNDIQALNQMYKAQTEMKTWIESKQVPGQFTGSTGARVLTPAELNSGHQAWARKDQLLSAQPVSGGMGMALLQKMGWKPGEGLGKNKEGTLEPLQLEVKLDKRGLVSDQDIVAPRMGRTSRSSAPTVKNLDGKHPVSLLGEYCSKRKYGAPTYELCFECGPDHKKNFLFKVRVNGIEYKPAVASPNKKLAKAEAAQICLRSIGLLR